MEHRDSLSLTKSVNDINSTLKAFIKVQTELNRALAKRLHPSQERAQSLTEEPIVVDIDWEHPSIKGLATIFKTAEGTTKIEIEIDTTDTERVDELISSGFVDVLRLSAMEE